MTTTFSRARALMIGCAAIFALGVGAAEAACLPDIKSAGKIRVGVGLMGLKPYIWQESDGKYAGLENNVLEYVLKDMGIPEYEYVVTEWTTLIPGLQSNRWDVVVSAMAITQERIQGAKIQFRDPYFKYVDRVIVAQDSPVQSEADLKGKTVASVIGTSDSIVAHALVDQGIVGKVQDFNNFGEPFVALRNKQVDGVVLDQILFRTQQDELKDLRTVGAPLSYIAKPEWAEAEAKADYQLGAVGMAVRAECDDLRAALNTALAKMEGDGTRKSILERYGIWDETQTQLKK